MLYEQEKPFYLLLLASTLNDHSLSEYLEEIDPEQRYFKLLEGCTLKNDPADAEDMIELDDFLIEIDDSEFDAPAYLNPTIDDPTELIQTMSQLIITQGTLQHCVEQLGYHLSAHSHSNNSQTTHWEHIISIKDELGYFSPRFRSQP